MEASPGSIPPPQAPGILTTASMSRPIQGPDPNPTSILMFGPSVFTLTQGKLVEVTLRLSVGYSIICIFPQLSRLVPTGQGIPMKTVDCSNGDLCIESEDPNATFAALGGTNDDAPNYLMPKSSESLLLPIKRLDNRNAATRQRDHINKGDLVRLDVRRTLDLNYNFTLETDSSAITVGFDEPEVYPTSKNTPVNILSKQTNETILLRIKKVQDQNVATHQQTPIGVYEL